MSAIPKSAGKCLTFPSHGRSARAKDSVRLTIRLCYGAHTRAGSHPLDGRGTRILPKLTPPKGFWSSNSLCCCRLSVVVSDKNPSAVFLIQSIGILDACSSLSTPDVVNVRSHLSAVRLTQGPLGAECKALGVATRGRMLTDRYVEISAATLTVRSWPTAVLMVPLLAHRQWTKPLAR
jgi:hypothetical protein